MRPDASTPGRKAPPDRGAAACPSTCCEEGALLLGVVTPAGTVAYVQPPTRISAEFVEEARALGHPERRFRFSGPCVESACPQWTGRDCSVIDLVLSDPPSDWRVPAERGPAAPPDEAATLPACGIRRTCRWYAQRGRQACAVCPTVVADTGGTATYRSAPFDQGQSV